MQLKTLGQEFSFDIYNLDDAENFEKALDEMSLAEKSIQEAAKTNKMTAVNRAMLAMFKAFFQTATGTDVIGDCRNSMTAQEAYLEFCEAIAESKANANAKYTNRRIR